MHIKHLCCLFFSIGCYSCDLSVVREKKTRKNPVYILRDNKTFTITGKVKERVTIKKTFLK